MKIENLERAVEAKEELKKMDIAIKNLSLFKATPGSACFLIAEHRDYSEPALTYQYKNGNAHPMYAKILEFMKQQFQAAREELIKEIEAL